MSIPQHKIDSLIKQNKYWAQSFKKIKQNNDRLLITILLWNNLVNVYTAALATTIAISIWESSGIAQATVIWVATWVVTFLLLLFWEIIPKSIATKNATVIALIVSPIYNFLMFILFPVIYLIEIIIKIFSGKAKAERMTDDEIESFIDMWRKSGSLDDKEHDQIKSILEFDETTVEEIMTPRVEIEALSIKSTVKEAMEFYLTHTHSRIPIYWRTIDRIDYFITSRDLIREYSMWNLDTKISDITLTEVLKVPLTQSISKLLETFQKYHKIMAIIIDEYGWVSWLITMEDIMEEVFWDIRDETDKESEDFVETWKNTMRVDSWVLIEDVLDRFDLELENIWLDEREFGWETLSYLITHILEWFPTNGQIITFDIKSNKKVVKILSCKILDIHNAKIWKVDIKLTKKEDLVLN
jgi:putative hemolysin